MMLYLFSLLLSLPFLANDKTEMIDWSAERRLSWNDFRGRPDPVSPNAALTSSNIHVDFEFDARELKYKIRCRFNTEKSWGRVKTDYILAHEQGHFDITEIHARKLYKALKNYKYNPKTVSADISALHQQVMTDQHNMQSAYDQQSDHSRNPVRQAEWDLKIQEELKALDAYKDYHK